jgi:hypothetical protein
LIVPFSWFIVQFVLSISAILTVGVLTLPVETFQTYREKLEKIEMPVSCTIDLTASADKNKEPSTDSASKPNNTNKSSSTSSSDLGINFMKCDDKKAPISSTLL